MTTSPSLNFKLELYHFNSSNTFVSNSENNVTLSFSIRSNNALAVQQRLDWFISFRPSKVASAHKRYSWLTWQCITSARALNHSTLSHYSRPWVLCLSAVITIGFMTLHYKAYNPNFLPFALFGKTDVTLQVQFELCKLALAQISGDCWPSTFITRYRAFLYDVPPPLFPIIHSCTCFLKRALIRDLDLHPSWWHFQFTAGPHESKMLFGSRSGVNCWQAFLITSISFTPTSPIKKAWLQQMHASCNYL